MFETATRENNMESNDNSDANVFIIKEKKNEANCKIDNITNMEEYYQHK